MSRNSIGYTLKAASATYYTTAIAGGGGIEIENFPALRSAGIGEITGITVQSVEKRAWAVEVQDYDENILSRHAFTEDEAVQVSVDDANLYTYYVSLDTPWPIPLIQGYETTPVGLRNMSDTAKTAGTDGAVTVILHVRM